MLSEGLGVEAGEGKNDIREHKKGKKETPHCGGRERERVLE